jgi:hypothetical protein
MTDCGRRLNGALSLLERRDQNDLDNITLGDGDCGDLYNL